MPETTYTNEQDLYIFENAGKVSFSDIGNTMERTRHQVRGRYLFLMEQFKKWLTDIRESEGEQKISRETTDTTDVICMVDPDIKSVDDLIDVMKVDLKVWRVAKAVCNKWGGFARTQSYEHAPNDWRRKLTKVPLYQVKVWLERVDGTTINNEKLRQQLIEDLRTHSPKYPKIIHRFVKVANRIMAEISIPDHHFGKLCWGDETGFGNYDLKIAEQMFLAAVEDLLNKIRLYPVDLILFPVGNDLLHVDGMENQTSAGTPQDVDGRWQKAFRVAKNCIVKALDMCRLVAPVEVVVIPGNHDRERTFYLGEVLDAHYRLDTVVKIDNRPTNVKFKEYGKTLIGFAHGDSVAEGELPLMMAGMEKDAFARTTHWEWHLGHRHTRTHRRYAPRFSKLRIEEGVKVNQGVHVRILPALCPPDAWHARSGYVLGPRASEVYLWQHDSGYAGHLVHNPVLDTD